MTIFQSFIFRSLVSFLVSYLICQMLNLEIEDYVTFTVTIISVTAIGTMIESVNR